MVTEEEIRDDDPHHMATTLQRLLGCLEALQYDVVAVRASIRDVQAVITTPVCVRCALCGTPARYWINGTFPTCDPDYDRAKAIMLGTPTGTRKEETHVSDAAIGTWG